MVPDVDRIAWVLYDPQDDLLKTFVNSTREGVAISGYEFRLADSTSLSGVASSGLPRILDDIPATVQGTSLHSVWLLKEGYGSAAFNARKLPIAVFHAVLHADQHDDQQ